MVCEVELMRGGRDVIREKTFVVRGWKGVGTDV